jgi:hypothetical protein
MKLPLFEISLLLVRLDEVARLIVNANHGIMWIGYDASRIRLHR